VKEGCFLLYILNRFIILYGVIGNFHDKEIECVHSDILRRIIVEQVASMMVLPNKLPIRLSDEVPATVLKMPEPEVCINNGNLVV
jgi:hypothetical protein